MTLDDLIKEIERFKIAMYYSDRIRSPKYNDLVKEADRLAHEME